MTLWCEVCELESIDHGGSVPKSQNVGVSQTPSNELGSRVLAARRSEEFIIVASSIFLLNLTRSAGIAEAHD